MLRKVVFFVFFIGWGCISPHPSPDLSKSELWLQGAKSLPLGQEALQASKLEWKPRADHVAMVIPWEPLRRLKEELESRETTRLQSRSDATLVLLSHQELKVLRNKMSLDEIHQLITAVNIQKTAYRPLCVALMSKQIGGQKLLTYYLKVESEGLIKVRQQLEKQFIEKGGSPKTFDPKAYEPRITVAYNDHDLLRDEPSSLESGTCIYALSWK